RQPAVRGAVRAYSCGGRVGECAVDRTSTSAAVDAFMSELRHTTYMAAVPSIILRDPEILGGVPCFRGTRVPFKNLLDYIETGETLDDFLEDFPSVTREMAIEAL